MEKFCGNRECVKSSKSASFFLCNRCQVEFYCSRKCQIDAFTNHRFHCFELPSLCEVSPGSLSPPNSPDNRVNDLSREVKHLQVFEQQIVESQNVAAEDEPVDESQTNASSLSANTEVMARNEEQRKLYRALKKFPDSFVPKRVPADANSQIDVNSNVKIQNEDRKSEAPPVPPRRTRFFYEDLKQKPLPRTKFSAFLLSGSIEDKTFAVVEASNQAVPDTVQKAVDQYVDNKASDPYEPKPNEIVLAKFEGIFYRGMCKEVRADGFLIYYLDYGNCEIVQKQDILKINENLVELDVVVHECHIENFPEDNRKIAEILSGGAVDMVDARKNVNGKSYIARIVGM